MRIQTFVIVASALSALTLLQSVVAAPGRRFKGHGRGNRESSTIKVGQRQTLLYNQVRERFAEISFV